MQKDHEKIDSSQDVTSRSDMYVSSASHEPNIDDVYADGSPSNTDPFKFSQGLTGVDQPANYLFVNILIATALVPVLIILLHRFLVYARDDRRRVSVISSCRGQKFWERDRYALLGLIKMKFLYAPLLGDRHSRDLRLMGTIRIGTLPTRPQTLVILIYVVSNVAYCLAIPKQLRAQQIAGFRGRCGALAAFNLIFTVLFALRNNPFIRILGVSYDTFNLFHRWTARLVIFESIAHVAAFMYNTHRVEYKGHSGWSSIGWVLEHSVSYRWGLAGFSAFIFLSLQSFGPFRRAFYDSFLTFHRIGVLVAISGIYFHVAKHALPQLSWIYLVITLFAFELLMRAGRVVYYNLSWSRRTWTKITAEALPGEATRLEISIPQSWGYLPGSHTYIYLPRLAPLTLHPFSVAWSAGFEEHSAEFEKPPANIDELAIKCSPSTISCVVRARKGMTRRLYERASRAESKHITLWGAIEGPYGGLHSLESYGTVALFAAGVGITHQLLFVRHLLMGYNQNTSATRKILLVWSVTAIECIEWIRPWLDQLANMPSFNDIAKVRLYISRFIPSDDTVPALHLPVEIYHHRCNPQEIIDEQILAQVGAMAVTVCGPGSFNDGVRAAVRHRVELRSIDFFEEAFSS